MSAVYTFLPPNTFEHSRTLTLSNTHYHLLTPVVASCLNRKHGNSEVLARIQGATVRVYTTTSVGRVLLWSAPFATSGDATYTFTGIGAFQPATKAALETAVDAWCATQQGALMTYGHISAWDTSLITDMSDLFKDKTTFNDDIGDWDTSSTTDMDGMFDGAAVFNQYIGQWDVSKVTSMDNIFTGSTLVPWLASPLARWPSACGSTDLPPCQLCAPGHYVTVVPTTALLSCTTCPAGTFSAAVGAVSADTCTPVPTGTYAAAGASEPLLCPAGTYGTNGITHSARSSQGGACTDCPAGTASPFLGGIPCSPCARGTHTPADAATSCVACGAGEYSMQGATQCLPCPIGTFSPGGWAECMPCFPGTVSASPGAIMCTACAAGTEQPAIGASACFACVA